MTTVSHFAGEFAEVPGKEPLVLPVEARRFEEILAVEIGAHAHLNPFEKVLMRTKLSSNRSSAPKQRPDIPSGAVTSNECRYLRTVRLEHVTGGTTIYEAGALGGVEEFEQGSGRQAKLGKDALGVTPIVFKAGSIGAAADDVVAFAAQTILSLRPGRRRHSRTECSLPQLRRGPIRVRSASLPRARSGPRACPGRADGRCETLTLVPLLREAQIESPEFRRCHHPEEAHLVRGPAILRRPASSKIEPEMPAIAVEAARSMPQADDRAFADGGGATRIFSNERPQHFAVPALGMFDIEVACKVK